MPLTEPRLLLIALDAADPVLIERWIGDASLPNLAALSRAGVSGRLDSSARYLAGSPWPTFYTSQPPSAHGLYHDFQWRHENMAFSAPGRDWLSASPFWRHLGGDVPVIAYDVPMNLGIEPFNGLEVSGWAAHDKLALPASHPADLLREIKRRFGEWHIGPEQYGPPPVAELLELRDGLVDGTRRSADLALWLMEAPGISRSSPLVPSIGAAIGCSRAPASRARSARPRETASTTACAISTWPATRPSAGSWPRHRTPPSSRFRCTA